MTELYFSLLYPKKVLARPFLTTVMRKEFDLEKHQLRKTGFKPSLIALCEALEEEATADNDGKLRTICSVSEIKLFAVFFCVWDKFLSNLLQG